MNNNTIDVNQQIISLREDGLMQKEIANELSITRDKVRYVLNKAGMTNYERSKECLNCGESFRSVGHHARFCSGRCRSKHHKQTTLKKESANVVVKSLSHTNHYIALANAEGNQRNIK